MTTEDEEKALRLLRAICGDSASYTPEAVELAEAYHALTLVLATPWKIGSKNFPFLFFKPDYKPDYLHNAWNRIGWSNTPSYATKLLDARVHPTTQGPFKVGISPLSRLNASASHLEAATKTVEQLSADLKEAEELRRTLLELTQLQQLRRANAELYGTDPETGLTAAQEYLAFKKSQREQ